LGEGSSRRSRRSAMRSSTARPAALWLRARGVSATVGKRGGWCEVSAIEKNIYMYVCMYIS
jgi:hypothetical protein